MKKMADMTSKAGKWLLVFGIVISQLSFPLQVLAEEVVEDTTDNIEVINEELLVENTDEVVVVNYDELTGNEYEYTINNGESLSVTFSLKSQGIVKEVTLDLGKKLYGEYHYTLDGTDKVLVINYEGNNIDLLNNYKNVVELTKELSCNESECIISGFGTKLVTVSDVLSYYDIETFETDYNAKVEIVDGGNVLVGDNNVVNGNQLLIRALEDTELVYVSESSLYTLNRVGDIHVPSDGIIDELDQETVLDNILLGNETTNINDINGDGELNILDATDSTFMDIYNGEEVTDILTNTLVLSNEEILIGDTVEVKLMISGFDKALIYGIEGLLNYDSNILELVGATLYINEDNTVEDLGYLNEFGKFAFVLFNGFNNTEEAILTLEFEALAAGNVDITISDIIESYGKAFTLESDNVTANLVVTDPADNKGGDVEEDETPEDNTTEEDETPEDNTTEEDTTTDSNEGTVGGTTTEVDKDTTVAVVKSNDYYIESLEIEGYDIDFDMYTYEYTIKVGSDITSLDFDVLLHSSKSIYYVEGNENFKEGENLVQLVVKAENGRTKTYTIKVVKEKTKEVVKDSATELEEEEEENSTSKTVVIILIILVIIGLIYVIFKDDEEDNKDNKTQSKTEPKKSESVKIEKVETKTNNTNKTTKSTKNNNSTKKNTKKGNKK